MHKSGRRRFDDLSQQILAGLYALDFKLLAYLELVQFAQLGWQDDLTFGRKGRFHIGKIPSYISAVKFLRPTEASEIESSRHYAPTFSAIVPKSTIFARSPAPWTKSQIMSIA